jgi:DnaJ-class molecular chaperone
MNLQKNYYSILEISHDSNQKEVKKAYYALSKLHHPDVGGDWINFNEIKEAYDVLSSPDFKNEYDSKSKWGSSYDEYSEYLNYEFSNLSKTYDGEKLDDWKSQNQLNILCFIDDKFKGSVEYERWVICKSCNGDGKDTSSKIEIRDKNGNVIKVFDGSDGCDFCEGTGKNWKGDACGFCAGKGEVGLSDCKSCKGEKRILGKQKLSKIKFPSGEKAFKVEGMGNYSKWEFRKVGDLWLIKKENPI